MVEDAAVGREYETEGNRVELKRKRKVIVVMPAYNAERTLRATYEHVPRDVVDEVILTDDCSHDRTVEVARSLGIPTLVHERNRGYGGNQKSCYQEALRRGADTVVMVHPDHQYDPRVIPDLIRPIEEGRCDAVFGSRMLGGRFLEGGMPIWKFRANVILTAISNIFLRAYLTEWHSGFRAYSRRYLETVNFLENSDDFVFDTEIIIQGLHHRLKIQEIPIETRYFDAASQISFMRSLKYGISIVLALVRCKLHEKGIRHFSFLRSTGNRGVLPVGEKRGSEGVG